MNPGMMVVNSQELTNPTPPKAERTTDLGTPVPDNNLMTTEQSTIRFSALRIYPMGHSHCRDETGSTASIIQAKSMG
jgi:hypothetical protein